MKILVIKNTFLLLLISSICVIIPNNSHAQLENPDLPYREGLKVKPLIVHGAYKQEVQLDTNVFLENEDAKFDVITIFSPSFGVELPYYDHNFSVDYDIRFNLFGVYNDHSYIDHKVRGLADLDFNNFYIQLFDEYRYFSDRAGTEDTNRVKRQNNFLSAAIGSEFEQLKVDFKYTFGVEDFLSDETLYTSTQGSLDYHDKDRFLNIFTGEVSYRFLPKTSILFESEAGILSYHSKKSSNSWYTETTVGLRGDLKKDLTINLKAGIRYQSYDTSTLTDSDDYLGPVARGSIRYYFSKDDMVDLAIERAVYESTFNNLNFYEVNHAGLNYTHYFNRKLYTSLYGYYQLNLYPSEAVVDGVTAKRYDNLFGGGCSLRYNVKKWLSLEARYEYNQRKSRFGTFNYVDNLITISGVVGF